MACVFLEGEGGYYSIIFFIQSDHDRELTKTRENWRLLAQGQKSKKKGKTKTILTRSTRNILFISCSFYQQFRNNQKRKDVKMPRYLGIDYLADVSLSTVFP